MSRRSLTLLIASVGTAVALAISVLVSVPYVLLGPGPTLNTLGKDAAGHQLITISGHSTYPTTGHLNMVTVSYQGGPGSDINLFSAITAWLNPNQAVVPESELFTPGQSQKQAVQQDTAEMTGSQEVATAAALTQLGISYQTKVAVVQTVSGYPASGVLKAGDDITAINGTPVTSAAKLQQLIRSHPAGTTLNVTVLRHGVTRQLRVGTKKSGGVAVMGIKVQEQYAFPFKVSFQVGNIGGPSAGMMFALGIIDKLTHDDLAGNRFIAGTGEITASGQVGPIGGIQQKMIGARKAGATIFLAPAGNCADTKGAVPAGMRVVKVSTLSQAVTYLTDIKEGKPVPSC